MTTSPPSLSDTDLHRLAERLLDALLSCADVDTIGRTRWWERAVSALEIGAAASTSFRQAVARAARRLQVSALSAQASETVAELAETLDDPALFSRWRTLARRDAVVITAMVRRTRTERRNNRTSQEETADA